MKRRFPMILSAILAMLTLFGVCWTAAAETRKTEKMVYVVIDDSGSMNEDKFSKTRYAMEVLCGLMNPRDRLEFYYLNNNSKRWRADLSPEGIEKTMDTAVHRVTSGGGTTPYEQVGVAFRDMLKASKETAYDQYWLIVLTDGKFTNGIVRADKLRDEFKKYVNTGFGPDGGGTLRMIYCTIGAKDSVTVIDENAQIRAELEELGIYCKSTSTEEIIPVMGEIADRVSGRSRFQGSSHLTQVDRRTVKISSSIPLNNFVVFSQGNTAELQSVSSSKDGALSISRSAHIKPPISRMNRLAGGIYTVDNGRKHISAGEYTLTFNQDVNVGNEEIIVLFEPAMELRVHQRAADAEIQGKPGDTVHVGQSYEVSAEILEAGTDMAYRLDELPKGSQLVIEISNGSRTAKGDAGNPAKIKEVGEEPVHVKAALTIYGFNPITFETTFTPIPKPPVVIEDTPNGVGGVENGKLTARTEELKPGKKEKYLEFRIADGNAPAADIPGMLRDGLLTLDLGGLYCEQEYDKGALRVYPRYEEGKMELNRPYTVTLTDGAGNSRQMTVTVVPSEFGVKVGPKDKLSLTEAELRGKPAVFEFTLLVDGREADAGQYDPMAFRADGGLSVQAEPANKKWKVTVEYQPGMKAGEYRIIPVFRNAEMQPAATLELKDSQYSVRVKPEKKSVREADFANQPVTFEFALLADGKEVDASAYEALAFRDEKHPELKLEPVLEGRKWKVTVGYTPGMPIDTYEIAASFRGQALQPAATLEMQPTEYAITVKPQTIALKQSELAESGKAFEITLKEGGKQISPDALTVDWGGFRPGGDSTDQEKKVRTLEVAGDLTVEPRDYEITLTYQAPSGHKTVQKAVLTVEKSEYQVIPQAEAQLVFSTPEEMAANEKQYRFDIRVDGRPLTEAEMQAVATPPEVDPKDTATTWTAVESGYIVTPRAAPGWIPPANKLEYTVTCKAGDQQASLKFFYTLVHYSVACVGGDGGSIPATGLGDNTTALAFRVYGDGAPLPYDMVNNNFTLSKPGRFGGVQLDTRVTADPDGACTVYVTPVTRTWGPIDLFTKPFTPVGEMPVTLEYKGASASGTLVLTAGSVMCWLPHLIAAVLIALAVLYIRKKRFGSNAKIYYYYCCVIGHNIRGTGGVQGQMWDYDSLKDPHPLCLLNPFGRTKTSVEGLRVRATACGKNMKRMANVEVWIGEDMRVKAILDDVDINRIPKVENPVEEEPLKKGWHILRNGSVIAVYERDQRVTLFKYIATR